MAKKETARRVLTTVPVEWDWDFLAGSDDVILLLNSETGWQWRHNDEIIDGDTGELLPGYLAELELAGRAWWCLACLDVGTLGWQLRGQFLEQRRWADGLLYIDSNPLSMLLPRMLDYYIPGISRETRRGRGKKGMY